MRRRGATGLLVTGVLTVVLGLGAVSADAAVYGLLDHHEVCAGNGDYASLTSVSVRDKVRPAAVQVHGCAFERELAPATDRTGTRSACAPRWA